MMPETELTLEEAVAKEAEHPFLGPDGVAALQRKCRRYREKDQSHFGVLTNGCTRPPMDGFRSHRQPWRSKRQSRQKGNRNPGQDEADRAEAIRLAIDALRDGDPAVVLVLGALAEGFDSPHPMLGEENWSWALAACRRGLDCSAQASWVQIRCRDRGGL